jgi:hypothetical protein
MELATYMSLREALDKSCSLDAFKKNVRKEYHAGKTAKGTQHVAIALSVLRRACGVSDDTKGSPKDIVALGQKESVGHFIPLDLIVEKGVVRAGQAVRRDFVLWLSKLRDAANLAHGEALSTTKYVSGKETQQLKRMMRDFCAGKRPFPAKGHVSVATPRKSRGAEKRRSGGHGYLWRDDVEDSPYPSLFEHLHKMASFGPDYTVAMGIHGVGTSPSASSSPEASRYNVQHTHAGIRRGRRGERRAFESLFKREVD